MVPVGSGSYSACTPKDTTLNNCDAFQSSLLTLSCSSCAYGYRLVNWKFLYNKDWSWRLSNTNQSGVETWLTTVVIKDSLAARYLDKDGNGYFSLYPEEYCKCSNGGKTENQANISLYCRSFMTPSINSDGSGSYA